VADFTIPNAEILIATRGDADGFDARLCCVATASFSLSEDSIDFTCNPAKGVTDTFYKNPSASIEIEDQNFNTTSLKLSLNATAATVNNYKVVGNSTTDPTVTPTATTQVDGAFTPTWTTVVEGVTYTTVLTLNSAWVISGSISFWTYDGTDFTIDTSVITETDLNIGKLLLTFSGLEADLPTTLYASYKHFPLEAGVTALQNAFSTNRRSYTIVIRHVHASGDATYDTVFWKCKADMSGTFNIHDVAGDKISVPMKFKALADTELHADSPLFEIFARSGTLSATPLIECAGDIDTEEP